jgi:hypothetical protein
MWAWANGPGSPLGIGPARDTFQTQLLHVLWEYARGHSGTPLADPDATSEAEAVKLCVGVLGRYCMPPPVAVAAAGPPASAAAGGGPLVGGLAPGAAGPATAAGGGLPGVAAAGGLPPVISGPSAPGSAFAAVTGGAGAASGGGATAGGGGGGSGAGAAADGGEHSGQDVVFECLEAALGTLSFLCRVPASANFAASLGLLDVVSELCRVLPDARPAHPFARALRLEEQQQQQLVQQHGEVRGGVCLPAATLPPPPCRRHPAAATLPPPLRPCCACARCVHPSPSPVAAPTRARVRGRAA